MFLKETFSKILSDINDTYSNMTEFSKKANFDRTYISKYINQKLDNPPSPKILEKIATASNGITTYEKLMRICGYFEKICGDRLKIARLNLNLSLEEVAKKVNITTELLSKWENGDNYNMDFDTSNKLSELYNVSIAWLVGLNIPDNENIADFRYASHNSINTEGLNENEIQEVKRYIEWLKEKKKKENK